MGRHDPNLSPFDAVKQVLLNTLGIKEPSNVLVMMLIDAVRDTTPPPREVTISMLSKILQSLDPSEALNSWATRSSEEIVKIMSQHPAVKHAAKLIDNEHMWCSLEGTIAGMLGRVCRGQDLEEVNIKEWMKKAERRRALYNLLRVLVEGNDNTREFLSMAGQHTDLDVPTYKEILDLYESMLSKEKSDD